MTLLISNLPNEVTQANVVELFEEYGAVKHILLTKDWKRNAGLSIAFVEMSAYAYEKLAMLDLNGCKWKGNQLQISEVAKDDPEEQTISLDFDAMSDGDYCDFW